MKMRFTILSFLVAIVLTACPQPPAPPPIATDWQLDFRGGTVNLDSSALAGAKDPVYRQMLETQLEKHTGLKVGLPIQTAASSRISAGTGISFYVGLKQKDAIPTQSATLEFQGPQKTYGYVDANNQPTQPVNPAGSGWIYSQFQQSQGSGIYRVKAQVSTGVVNAETTIDTNNRLEAPIRYDAGAAPDGTFAAAWDSVPSAKSYLSVLYDLTTKKTVWAAITNQNFVEVISGLTLDQTHNYDLTISAFNFDFNISAKAPIPTGLEAAVNSVIFRRQFSIGVPFLRVERKNRQLNDNETIRIVVSGQPNGEASGSIDFFNSASGALRYELELPSDANVQLSSINGAITNSTSRKLEVKTACGATESDRTVVGQLKTNAGNTPVRNVVIQIECLRSVSVNEVWKQFAGMSSISEFVLNPQGTMLLAVGNEGIRIWETATSKIIYSKGIFPGQQVRSPTWKPDGTQFAYSDTSKVTMVDLASQSEVFSVNISITDRVIWSPDGNKLFISAYNTAKFIRADTGADIMPFVSWTGDISNVSLSPDGTRIAATVFNNSLNSKTLTIWNTGTGEVERRIDTDYFFRGLAWNASGSQIAVGYRNQIRVWDVATGLEQPNLTLSSQNANNEVRMYGWDSSNGRFIVDFDAKLSTVNASSGAFIQEFVAGGVPSVALQSNKIATARSDLGLLTFRIYDLTTTDQSASVTSRADSISSIVWHPNSTIFAVLGTQTARILNKAGDLQRELPVSAGFFWSRDGTQYATSSGSVLQIRDSISGNVVREIQGAAANQVFWNADSSLIAIQESLRVRVLNAITGAEVWRLEDARSVAANPSGTKLVFLVGEMFSQKIQLHTFNTGLKESTVDTTGLGINFSLNWGGSDNRFIGYGGVAGGIVTVFDLASNTNFVVNTNFTSISNYQWDSTGRRIFMLVGNIGTTTSNLVIASGISGDVGNSLINLTSSSFVSPKFAVSPDGSSLVTTLDNSGLKFWNLVYTP